MDGFSDLFIGDPGIVRLDGNGMGRGNGAGGIGGCHPFLGCADFENAISTTATYGHGAGELRPNAPGNKFARGSVTQEFPSADFATVTCLGGCTLDYEISPLCGEPRHRKPWEIRR